MNAAAILALYAQRMRIERQFRDTKNAAVGLERSRSKITVRQRLQMLLLLLSHIASLTLRLIGKAAKARRPDLHLTCAGRNVGNDRFDDAVKTRSVRCRMSRVWPSP